MTTANTFSAVLIGTESLLIQCADLWRRGGHTITAVVSNDVEIVKWATASGLTVLPHNKQLAANLADLSFDYLFSITNLKVLPADLLKMPQRQAINFHDGPLPDYAGLYTPNWALLNGEDTHGITWHTMTAEIDEGDILQQKIFPISADETAFTLNVKCYEAGIETFGVLIDELAAGTVSPRPQDLSQKQYFGKYDRPENAAVIDWRQPASEISALVRALDFGSYENPLLRAKIYLGRETAVVPAITIDDAAIPDAAPGTILSLSPQQIRIATATKPVVIGKLLRVDGRPYPLEALGTRTGLRTGDRLPAFTDQPDAHLIDAMFERIARQEATWVRTLSQVKPVDLPYTKSGQTAGGRYQVYRPTDNDLAAHLTDGEEKAEFLAAAFSAFIARLTGTADFAIALSHPPLNAAAAELNGILSPLVPLLCRTSADKPVGPAVERLQKAMLKTVDRFTYTPDVLSRYPQLKNAFNPADLPVGVSLLYDDDADLDPPARQLNLFITTTGSVQFIYDRDLLEETDVVALARQFVNFVTGIVEDGDRPLGQVPLLSEQERHQLLVEWNDTAVEYDKSACLHDLITAQAARTPDETAVVFGRKSYTYRELDQRANQLAHYLCRLGAGPDKVVGLYIDRSAEMIVALLGVLKAGAAYLPLDPTYPADRIAFMVEDAGVSVLLTYDHLADNVPESEAAVVRLDGDWAGKIASQPSSAPADTGVKPHHLSYIIYTSGSTGKPKGVMVEHRNVVNFLVGMDEHIPQMEDACWLTVTSLSFDISVLEIFWSLSRGVKLVVYADQAKAGSAGEKAITQRPEPMQFSAFYFASDESEAGLDNKYELLLEGAKFADANGFSAVWTPERHFGAFGGLYPNPAVTGAAIAAITENVDIRAGSCVLPLHHPVRVAEEWAVVDNISNGRVGIAFAAGWQPNDFLLKPENFEDNKGKMFRDIDIVQRLWQGEKVTFDGPKGPVTVSTLPRPHQPELPIWITIAGNPDSFRMAGENGYNVLTHLLGQTVEEVGEKIAIYRRARREAGHEGDGHVSIMLHTFIGQDVDQVRETVRKPLMDYLKSSVFLIKEAAWNFPTFKKKADEAGGKIELDDLSDEEMDALTEFAFDRYFENSGLLGDREKCVRMVDALKEIGVNEIACQIDFGVDTKTAVAHLPYLKEVLDAVQPQPVADEEDMSIPALIKRHDVTHFQCTPSMMSMLMVDERMVDAVGDLTVVMLGGEAMPQSLAAQINQNLSADGRLLNMYGPTETTIWSAVHPVNDTDGPISIGRPIANTQLYIVDEHLQPVPVGVPGELLIGGDGVVRGYHNRGRLTAERFVADPFINDGQARLYRTGDLARYRPDGNIDFLGRMDFQVKLRGYRIELGEIEALLVDHAAVREAVVTIREDTPGDKRMVAYCIPAVGHDIDAVALRAHLQEQLPDFMVPVRYVSMDVFPLTPNKKTDRKALPAPDQQQAVAKTQIAFVPPENELENKIAAIWQPLLGVDRIGVDDNFFDLGGHSLLAVQAHRQVKDALETDFSIADMFRFPTVRQLAEHLQDGQAAQEEMQNEVADRVAARLGATNGADQKRPRRRRRRRPQSGQDA